MATPGATIKFLGVDSSIVDLTEKKSSQGNNKTQYFTADEIGGASNELSEILANGNTTGANDISIDNGQNIVSTGPISSDSFIHFFDSGRGHGIGINSHAAYTGGGATIAEDYVDLTCYGTNALIGLYTTPAWVEIYDTRQVSIVAGNSYIWMDDASAADLIQIGAVNGIEMFGDVNIQTGYQLVLNKSTFTNTIDTLALTADRTINFQDADGTVAFLSDVTANNELSEILANGASTGTNDITISAAGGNRKIVTDNSTSNNSVMLSFLNSANMDTLVIAKQGLDLGGSLTIAEANSVLSYLESGGASFNEFRVSNTGFLFDRTGTGQKDFTLSEKIDLKIQSKDAANFYGELTSGNITADRTYTFQDASGTVAFLSDVTAGDTNFATSDLTFTVDRAHNTDGNSFEVTTDNGGYAQGLLFVDTAAAQFGVGTYYADFRSAYVDFFANGENAIKLWSNSVVMNEGGLDRDFRVESDTIPNAFFIQGSDGYIGVGVVPSYKFDIEGTGLIESHVKSSSNAANLRVNAATNFDAGVYLMENDVDKWRVYNDGSTGDDLAIYNYTAAGFSMHIDGTNNWTCIGGTAAQTMLDVRGGGKFSDNLELIPPGSTASDIALTIRNSGDSADMLTVTGQGALLQVIATAPTVDITDASHMYVSDVVAGTAAHTFRNENGDIIKMYTESALTTALTTLTFVDENTPDFALSSLTTTTPAGFATLDEAQGFVEVVVNNQARINDLESKIQNIGFLA